MVSDSPHEGIAVLNLFGTDFKLRYDWAAFSRIEQRFGGKEDMNNPVHLSEIIAHGLETYHPGQVTPEAIRAFRPPLVWLSERIQDAFSYALGTHPSLKRKSGEADGKARKTIGITSAYKAGLKVGIDPEQFWRLTPFQTSMMVDVWMERHKEETKMDLWRAYHTGMFARDDHRLPKYDTLFPKTHDFSDEEDPRERAMRLKKSLMIAFPPKAELEAVLGKKLD